jgi:hypothetical protein
MPMSVSVFVFAFMFVSVHYLISGHLSEHGMDRDTGMVMYMIADTDMTMDKDNLDKHYT